MSQILKFRRRPEPTAGTNWRSLDIVIFSCVVGAFIFYMVPWTTVTPSAWLRPSEHFGLCYTGGGINCVVDGDTFWMDGKDIRVADIDAPETHPPRCRYEAELGDRATLRLQALLNEGPVQLEAVDRDTDGYGRALRIATRNGQSLGLTLVDEGLARRWTGSRQPWC